VNRLAPSVLGGGAFLLVAGLVSLLPLPEIKTPKPTPASTEQPAEQPVERPAQSAATEPVTPQAE